MRCAKCNLVIVEQKTNIGSMWISWNSGAPACLGDPRIIGGPLQRHQPDLTNRLDLEHWLAS